MITAADIEKAFSERVPYRLSSFKQDNRTALRDPTKSEVKARLLALVERDAT